MLWLMLKKKYINEARKYTRLVFPKNKAFIFGSSLRKDHFRDVDIAIEGNAKREDIMLLSNLFEASNFPFFVDVVPFDKKDDSFRDYVLNKEKKEWI